MKFRMLLPAAATARAQRMRALLRGELAAPSSRWTCSPGRPSRRWRRRWTTPLVELPSGTVTADAANVRARRARQPDRDSGDQRARRPQRERLPDRAAAAGRLGTGRAAARRRRGAGARQRAPLGARRCLRSPSRLARLPRIGAMQAIVVEGLERELRRGPCRSRRRPRGRRGRDLRLPGPERRRQDDDRADADHAAAADRRRRQRRRPRRRHEPREVRAHDRRRPAGGGARPADDRPRADPAPGDAARARRAARASGRADDAARARRPGRRPPTAASAPTRAGCGAASTSPRRWSTSRGSCSSTSRPPASTRSAARRSGRRSQELNRRGHHRLPHHPVPGGGRPARRPRRDHRQRQDRRRGHAGGAQGRGRQPAPRGRARRRAAAERAERDLRAVRQAAARQGRQGAGRARARRRRGRARRPGARRGRARGRVARPGPADPRRRLRREDRPAPRGRARRARRARARRSDAGEPRPLERRLATNARVVARARDALGPPDLPPPAAGGADHRLPDPAAGDPDRRRRRARSTCPGSRRSTASSTSCSPGRWCRRCCWRATAAASRWRVDIEMGFTDRLFAAPISRFAIVLGRLAGHGGAGLRHRGLVPRDRADLRRARSRRACSGALWIVVLVGLSALAFGGDRRRDRAADRQRQRRPGAVPARLRDPLPLHAPSSRQDLMLEPAATVAEYNPLSFIVEGHPRADRLRLRRSDERWRRSRRSR